MTRYALTCQYPLSCGGVYTVRHYTVAPDETARPHAAWGLGHAVLNEDMCIWVGEADPIGYRLLTFSATENFKLRAVGPLGLPVVPYNVSERSERPGYTAFTVWLIKDQTDATYRFDPKNVSLLLSDGQFRKPVRIHVSHFDSYWEEVRGAWGGKKKVERMGVSHHLETRGADAVKRPVLLYDWSRFNLLFVNLPAGVGPKSITVKGIVGNKTALKKVVFTLGDTIESVYAMPGRLPDKTWLGDTPSIVCRKLFAEHPQNGY